MTDQRNTSTYIWRGIRDECVAVLRILRDEWQVAGVFLIAFVVVVAALRPLPPNRVRIGMGQPGSGLAAIASTYRDELAKEGIVAELVATAGAIDNLQHVAEGKVDLAFSQSGLPASEKVAYLGSIEYQPLWVFHRGQAKNQDLADLLIGKTVSIGIEGSGSRMAADRVLNRLGGDLRSRTQLLALDAATTINDLLEGRIDVAFFLSPFNSPNTQRVLADPTISVLDFPEAVGFSFLLGFADHVVLPAGSTSFYPAKPPHDIHMMADTITFVAQPALHPAIQSLLLSISVRTSQHAFTPYSRGTSFPRFIDKTLFRSPVAERFYKNGGLFLSGRMPYWLASFLDNVWIGFVAFLAIVYPLSKAIPSSRRLLFDVISSHYYRRIRDLEANLAAASTPERLETCSADLLALFDLIRKMWVPNGCSSRHGALLVTAMNLDNALKRRQADDH